MALVTLTGISKLVINLIEDQRCILIKESAESTSQTKIFTKIPEIFVNQKICQVLGLYK